MCYTAGQGSQGFYSFDTVQPFQQGLAFLLRLLSFRDVAGNENNTVDPFIFEEIVSRGFKGSPGSVAF